VKQRALILIFLTICAFSFGQTYKLGTSVISSFGVNYVGADLKISGVMGELMVSTFNGTSGNNYLTQGFLQNDGVVNAVSDNVRNGSLTVFPNPVKDKIFISENSGAGIVNAVLYDISGKVVFNTMLDLRFDNSVDMQSLTKGLYILRVYSTNGKILGVTKIEKH
jgi:hypothetical protein